MIQPAQAMSTEDLSQTIDRSAVQAFTLICRVLYLQARLDVLDRCCDERNSPPSHHACQRVTDNWQLALLAAELSRVEEAVVEFAAVHAEGAEHAVAGQLQCFRYRVGARTLNP